MGRAVDPVHVEGYPGNWPFAGIDRKLYKVRLMVNPKRGHTCGGRNAVGTNTDEITHMYKDMHRICRKNVRADPSSD